MKHSQSSGYISYSLLVLFFCLINTTAPAQETLPSPSAYLNYPLGSEFTAHSRVVDYFKHVSEISPNVLIRPYGETYEGRPLLVAILSSPENLERLEEIRTNNLKRAHLLDGTPIGKDPVIVWLSYNVHGDEASSTEAALKTLYYLANPENADAIKWLENVIVIMDPCLNPDGRERYVNFYRQYRQHPLSVNHLTYSHQVPWPGGRMNHYLFDLNRDWVWQTQIESKQRLKLYNEWMPQIHVDFHEQGVNSPYYFAPAAEPLHTIITPFQRSFQKVIGDNHARYFDKNYWLYFTGEEFDLLYPSYGDTYPIFNGAIGMTYEQAGSRNAGLGVLTEYGDTLTLKDRLDHHFTTGISTVEVSSKNADKLVTEFQNYFDMSFAAPFSTYILPRGPSSANMKKLLKLLQQNKIRYGHSSHAKSFEAYDYFTGDTRKTTLTTEDILIPVDQPKGRLVTALFEPRTKMSDSVTYDITAWSLPYAYGLNALATSQALPVSYFEEDSTVQRPKSIEKPYAWILPCQTLEEGSWIANALNQGIQAGILRKGMHRNGSWYPAGSVVITRAYNKGIKNDLDRIVQEISLKTGVFPQPLESGLSEEGVDLGSNQISRLSGKNVAILAGEGTSPYNVGEFWHFFEQQLHYPLTLLPVQGLAKRDLESFDVVLLPEGRVSDGEGKALEEWVKAGGTLIAIGSSLHYFAESKDFNLNELIPDKSPDSLLLSDYAMNERINISENVSGAIFPVVMDATHPLAYGYSSTYYSLTTSSNHYYLSNGQQIGKYLDPAKPVSGFAGSQAVENKSNAMVFGMESKGSGRVVYIADNPLFRSFWENGKLLIFNAIFRL